MSKTTHVLQTRVFLCEQVTFCATSRSCTDKVTFCATSRFTYLHHKTPYLLFVLFCCNKSGVDLNEISFFLLFNVWLWLRWKIISAFTNFEMYLYPFFIISSFILIWKLLAMVASLITSYVVWNISFNHSNIKCSLHSITNSTIWLLAVFSLINHFSPLNWQAE